MAVEEPIDMLMRIDSDQDKKDQFHAPIIVLCEQVVVGVEYAQGIAFLEHILEIAVPAIWDRLTNAVSKLVWTQYRLLTFRLVCTFTYAVIEVLERGIAFEKGVQRLRVDRFERPHGSTHAASMPALKRGALSWYANEQ